LFEAPLAATPSAQSRIARRFARKGWDVDFGGVVDGVIGFVRANQGWVAPAVFLMAFFESLAFVSLLVPATAILGALGLLIGAGDLPFWTPFLAAVAGAFLGDWISYEIGRRYKDEVKGMWPFSRQPQLFERGEAMFRRFGAPGYFGGRFIGPLRAVFPLICGISAMRPLTFQATNALSAIAWAAVYLGAGIGFGRFFA
jgi:membrane protein DedA with SNARE-associated domain